MTRERIELNGHGESYNPSRDHSRARPWSNGHAEGRISAPGRDEVSAAAIDFEDDEAQFLRTERRIPVRRGPIAKKTANQLKTTFALAVALALVGCFAWAARVYGEHAPRFYIDSSDNIEVVGVNHASRSQVMDVVREDLIARNVFSVSLDDCRRKLEQIPWIESATVMRLLPNRIAVSLAERTPVAFVLIGSKTGLIDADGVIMGPPASRQSAYRFPVIRGIADNEALSSRAAVMKIYTHLVRELDSGDPDQRFTRDLSEVDLADPEDVKVTVSDDGGTVLVHLGASDFLEHYKLYAAHIGEWRRQYHNVQSVDLRWEGQIIVNPDGEHLQQAEPAATENNPTVQAKPPVSHRAHSLTRHRRQKRGGKK